MNRRGLLCCALALGCGTAAAAAAPIPVAPGIDVIAGTFVPQRQPDGNSVIFRGPDGLVVLDTGRHAEHTQQIIDFAAAARLPIKAIINSHWHLDHIGGNSRIRAAFPDVRIYASGAIEGAVHGFLADYRKDLEGALQKAPNDPGAPGWRDELTLIAAAPQSYPTDPITRTEARTIAGRRLILHLETNTVTAADVWVFDPATRVLAAGDLVTLPVPFLDTACPQRWKSALDTLGGVRFKTLVPGHGPPMRRADFETYRHAYGNLLACAASTRTKSECGDGWIRDAGPLLGSTDRAFVQSLLGYYLDSSLRGDPAGIAKLCG